MFSHFVQCRSSYVRCLIQGWGTWPLAVLSQKARGTVGTRGKHVEIPAAERCNIVYKHLLVQ